MKRRALVCGGGIGGLAAGIGLSQTGWDVTIFEREPELRTAGVGLNLWPNGVRVLDGLGLGKRYREMSVSLQRYRTYSSDGSTIGVDDLTTWSQRYRAPLTGVHRRDLNAMLADVVGRERIRLDHRLTGFDDDGTHVHCVFANGERASGDLLIGADGVRSATREVMFGAQEFRYDGLVRWRAIFDIAASGVDPYAQVEVLSDGGHLGYLPIGGGRAYWFAAAEGFEHDADAACEYFSSWHGSLVPAIIAVTDRSTVIRNSLQDFVAPLINWSHGRVTLLGDAAHPMLPGMAQGAGQALEDVAALTRALADDGDIASALRGYEAQRLPLVAPVVQCSRSLFDFSDQHQTYESESANLIFRRYAQYVEHGG